MTPDLSIKIGTMEMKNPVMAASGTFGYGEEYSEITDIEYLGAIVTKGVGAEDWQGNPYPRIVETPCGLINAVGLQNPGVEYFIEKYMPFLSSCDTGVIVNIWGGSVEEYVSVASKLNNVEGVDCLELNVSCPNIKQGGIAFGTDPVILRKVVSKVRSVVEKPLVIKLSPNVSDISVFASICEEEGADAVSLINSIPAMVIDIETRRPALSNVVGGLSGPCIHPIAVKMVWEAAKAISIPVIGIGGITCAGDAIELMLAGASAVAIGTATFADPLITKKVVVGISAYLERNGFKNVSELKGALIL